MRASTVLEYIERSDLRSTDGDARLERMPVERVVYVCERYCKGD